MPSERGRRSSQLERLTPPGQHRYLHSLASTLPGAGAELLRELTGEADRKGWSLSLDASNEKLVGYYAKFGFTALGAAVTMPDGSRRVADVAPWHCPGRGTVMAGNRVAALLGCRLRPRVRDGRPRLLFESIDPAGDGELRPPWQVAAVDQSRAWR